MDIYVVSDVILDLIASFCLQVVIPSPASGGHCGWSSSREEAG